MGPLKAAGAHVSGEKCRLGVGEALVMHGVRARRPDRIAGCGPVDRRGFFADRGALASGCAQSSATCETYRRVFG